jgi:uncharacterized protein YvpB
MPSKSLTFLKWLLAGLFVLDAAAIGVVLVIIYLFYPGNLQSFFRPTVAIAQAPTAVPTVWIYTVTPFPPLPLTATVSASPTATPTATATLTYTPTQTRTFTPTNTFTTEPTATLTPVPTQIPTAVPAIDSIPSEALISGLVGYPQQYTLDCESRSAVDLAAYFGVSIDQMTFQNSLPLSDDPEEGFVGYYWGVQGQLPPSSYGVHAPPVAALLRAFGLRAYDQRGLSWDALRAEIAAGRPVMVWVILNTEPGWPVAYTASNGRSTIVAQYEHTVIVIGYSLDYVTLLDGDLVYIRSVDQFLQSWGVLGNMAVTIEP